MLVTVHDLPADVLAQLRAPVGLPGGVAFQAVSMEASLGTGDRYRLIASVMLADDTGVAAAAEWLWEQIKVEAPCVVAAGGVRARVNDAAALAWVLGKARDAE